MKKHLSSSLFSYRLSAVTRRLSERKMESWREEEKFSRKSRSWGMQGAPSVQGGIYSSSLRRAIWRVSTENAAAGLLEDCPPRPFFLYRETKCAGGAIFWEKGNNSGRREEERQMVGKCSIHYSRMEFKPSAAPLERSKNEEFMLSPPFARTFGWENREICSHIKFFSQMESAFN